VVERSSLAVRRTPCILVRGDQACEILPDMKQAVEGWDRVYFKLENLQTTGSFKIRGVANQFERVKTDLGNEGHLVTMSAGNYGRSYAAAAKALGLTATVLLPSTAPASRETLLKQAGVSVERMESKDLMRGVERHEAHGATFLHPFDCRHLIAGHASLGLELVEQVPDLETVVVCCGGGGLLAGVATAVKLHRPDAKIIGVEPETACAMQRSLALGKPASMPEAKSIAAGLAPPFAGANAFQHVSAYVDRVVLVTEEQIRDTCLALHNNGLVVEPSGSAALAAALARKVPASKSGGSLVVVLTGGNVTPGELAELGAGQSQAEKS